MSHGINSSRRRFVSTTAMTVVGTRLGVLGSAHGRLESTVLPGTTATAGAANTSFGSLKQIDAGLLNIGYADVGPSSGPAVILLHGWPYDIHSFVDVAPRWRPLGTG
jgi:hypothetical protein